MGGGWRNKLAYLGLTDLQMPIIHTWNVSLNMWNYHTNYRCSPSFACPCEPYYAAGGFVEFMKHWSSYRAAQPRKQAYLATLSGLVCGWAQNVPLAQPV